MILQGRKDKKNIYYLERHSTRDMPEDSKVQMKSENVEVFRNLAQGRICCINEPSSTSINLKKKGKDFPYK